MSNNNNNSHKEAAIMETTHTAAVTDTTWSVCHFNPPGRPQGDPDPKGQRFWQQFQTEEEARTVYHRLLKVRDSMLTNPDICGPAITVYQPVQMTAVSA